ncbi:hypothetical protein IWW47_000058 [Coemansia sp. RSA 2052]|nr:hypothetical protein IWW47_000058 [Coemansia sp. RSA 2052]
MLVTRFAHIAATAAGVAVAVYIEPYAALAEATLGYPTPTAHAPGIEWTHAPWAVIAEGQANGRVQDAQVGALSGAAESHAEGDSDSPASNVSDELSALESASDEASSSAVHHSSQHASRTNAAATHGARRGDGKAAPSLMLAIAICVSCLVL